MENRDEIAVGPIVGFLNEKSYVITVCKGSMKERPKRHDRSLFGVNSLHNVRVIDAFATANTWINRRGPEISFSHEAAVIAA